MATEINITNNPSTIDDAKFKDLVKELMENSLSGDTSPFNNVKEILNLELEKSPDLDVNQKAGIISDFLRDTFMDLNKQAMTMALDILKTNEELKLKTYATESEYNLSLKKGENMVIENSILLKGLELKAEELAIAKEKVLQTKLEQVEIRAKLKKQYGVMDTVTYQAADGTATYAQFTDGRWYEADPVTGDWILDGNNNMIPMLISGNTPIVEQLMNTPEPGALDKQIAGYDKVNYKDLIKTYHENISMLANAQVPPPPWMINTTKLLTEMVTDGKINITGESISSSTVLGSDTSADTTTVQYSHLGSIPSL